MPQHTNPTPAHSDPADDQTAADSTPTPGSQRKRRRRTILLSSLTVVAVLVIAAFVWGPSVYQSVFVGAPDADPQSELVSEAASGSAGAVVPQAGSWTVGQDSYAGYRVDEQLRGSPVTVTGRTEQVSGSATSSDTQLTDASVEVDIASIATDSSNRDQYFVNTAMNAAEFPSATFTLTSPVDIVSDGSLAQSVSVAGDLTIKGATQSVTADVTVVAEGDQIKVGGSIPITFADYGVEAPNLGFVSVEDHGSVEFLLMLQRG